MNCSQLLVLACVVLVFSSALGPALLVLAVEAQPTAAAPTAEEVSTAPPAASSQPQALSCQLSIQGNPSHKGHKAVQYAGMQCTGPAPGTLVIATATEAQGLADQLQSYIDQGLFNGSISVKANMQGGELSQACGQWTAGDDSWLPGDGHQCMLLVCSSEPVVVELSAQILDVDGVKASGANEYDYETTQQDVGCGLCIGGSATIHLVSSRFRGNTELTPLCARNNSVVRITGSRFEGNTAEVAGSIHVAETATLVTQDTVFSRNKATSENNGWTGGVLASGSASVQVQQGSVFDSNTGPAGAAVALYCYSCSVNISGALFVNNSATTWGGAISSKGTQLHITQTVFRNNSAEKQGGAVAVYGSVQTAGATHLTISDSCQFENNTAQDYGGALDIEGGAIAVIAGPNTAFSGNNAGKRGYGGAVSVMENGTLSLVQGVLLVHNTGLYGGALYTAGSGRVMVNGRVEFVSNWCPRQSGGIGGAAAVDGDSRLQFGASVGGGSGGQTSFNSAPVIFRNNTAYNGGAIVALNKGSIVFNDLETTIIFDSNSAQQGGAVYTMYEARLYALAGQQIFMNNTAWLGGAALASGFSEMVFDPWNASNQTSQTNSPRSVTNFKSNTAQYGGAVGADEDGLVNLGPGTLVLNNYASDSGGAAYATGQGHIVLNGTVVDSCSAMRRGGASFTEGVSSLTLAGNTQLVNCSASQTGGAVCSALKSKLIMQGVGITCKDSTARWGGCIHAEDSAQIVVHSNSAAEILNNEARGDGGGVYVSAAATLTVEADSTLLLHDNNASQGSGGGIAAAGSSSIALLSDSSSSSDGDSSSVASQSIGACAAAASGGSLSLGAFGSGSLQPGLGLVIFNNTCSSNGGGLALLDSSVLAYQLNSQLCITHNRAAKAAGGILLQGRITSSSGSSSDSDSDALAIAAIAAAVEGNTASIGNSDLSPMPDYLEVLEVLPDLNRFVSREGRDEGVIQIHMRVTGRGIPVQGIQLQASRSDPAAMASGDRDLLGGSVVSNTAGVAAFNALKLQQKPGTYTITISAPQYPDKKNLTQNFTVKVVPCTPGEVAGLSGDYCRTCQAGEYSFSPSSVSCERCAEGSGARCLGGALVMLAPGFWHPRPDPANMTRCPNQEACLGFPSDTCSVDNHTRQAFRACHPYCTSTYGDNRISNCSSTVECNSSCTVDTYMKMQCAEGYEGNLCGVCSEGYGTRGVFQRSKCLDSKAVVLLYVVGAVILLSLVRTLGHLTETQNLILVAQLASNTAAAATAAGWKGASSSKPPVEGGPGLLQSSSSNVQKDVEMADQDPSPFQSQQQRQEALVGSHSAAAGAAVLDARCSGESGQSGLSDVPSRELGLAVIESWHKQQQQQHSRPSSSSKTGKGLFEQVRRNWFKRAGTPGTSSSSPEEPLVGRRAPLQPSVVDPAAPADAAEDAELGQRSRLSRDQACCFTASGSAAGPRPVLTPPAAGAASADITNERVPANPPKMALTSSGIRHEQWIAQKLSGFTARLYKSKVDQTCSGQLGMGGRSLPSDVLRAIVLYLQYWAILGSMRLTWPKVLAWPISSLAALFATGSSVNMSVDCLIQTMGYTSGEAVALGRIVFYLGTVFVMLAVLLLFELIVWQLLRVAGKFTGMKVTPMYVVSRVRVSLLALAALQTFYPAVVRSCLSAVVCVPIAESRGVRYYWAGYLNQPCGQGWHATLMWVVGMLGTLLVCIGMPLFLFWKLMRNSHKLDSPLILAKYGSLYRCYRLSPITRAWESVIMLQTTVLVAISLFGYSLGEYYQAILMNFVLTLGVIVLLKVRPYQCSRLQRLVTAGVACLALTTYAALTFLSGSAVGADSNVGSGGMESTLGDYSRDVIGILVVAINAAFAVWGLYELCIALDWQQVKALVKMVVSVCGTIAAGMRDFAATSWEHGAVRPVEKGVENT